MTIVLFIVVLLVCVLVHEWGHFFAARTSGMLVEEFGFGIPPRIWSFKNGETRYSINALPIGGFVKIAGENGSEEGVPYTRQFESKPWYLKSAVLIAGVVMNFVLAVVLFAAAHMIGLPGRTPDGVPTVVSVVAGSPVESAGIAVGDTIRSISVGNVSLDTFDTDALRTAIGSTKGAVEVTYVRDGVDRTATLTPAQKGDTRMIGISIEPIGTIKQPFGTAISHAFTQSIAITGEIFKTIGVLIRGVFDGAGSATGLVGPIGLAREVGNAATFGLAYLLAFIATISLNLAVLNILPFPALDGGRLLVVWMEALTRKKFSPTVVGMIHTAGFLLLLTLMVVLSVGDIKKAL